MVANGSVNTSVARQWHSRRNVIAATDTQAIIEDLLEAVFSVLSLSRLNNESQLRPGTVREPRGRLTSAVGSRYQAAQWGAWLRTLVCVWFVKCSRELFKNLINIITNPNPVFTACTWQLVSEVGLIESRPKREATSRRQDGIRQDCRADSRTGVRQASSRIFSEGLKSECQDIVEQPVTSHAKEETAHSLRARDVGEPTNLGNFVRTERKRRNGGKPEGY
jgi:hypothetical protein